MSLLSQEQELISSFEEEQKSIVFSALSDYLHSDLYTDVTLVCRGGQIRSHKLILASSVKFFRDLFRHNPHIQMVDLDKELTPNDLFLNFEDVKLIVGILYCVGSITISPQRIQSLLIAAQVLGIPSLIRFLKRIDALIRKDLQINSNSFQCPPNMFVDNSTHQPSYFTSVPITFPRETYSHDRNNQAQINNSEDNVRNRENPSTVSTRTLESFEGFNLPSPNVRSDSTTVNQGPIRTGVNSVLESIDPSFLNHLHSNQIDDLENALLPHLDTDENEVNNETINEPSAAKNDESEQCDNENPNQNEDDQPVNNKTIATANPSNSPPASAQTVGEQDTEDIVENGQRVETNGGREDDGNIEEAVTGFSRLLPTGNQNLNAPPVILRPDHPPQSLDNEIFSPVSLNNQDENSNLDAPSSPMGDLNQSMEDNAKNDNDSDVGDHVDDLIIDEEDNSVNPEKNLNNSDNPTEEVEESENTTEAEISLDIGDKLEDKVVRLSFPGSSESVTLNFSADALMEMKKPLDERKNTPISIKSFAQKKTKLSKNKKKKTNSSQNSEEFSCHICKKSLKNQALLLKHMNYHVETISSCKLCNKLFSKKWEMDEHMSTEHKMETPIKCEECDKEFKWSRNLLAHMQLNHSKEKRYRCKFCPLTFLKRKNYINHQISKHVDRPKTWCEFCSDIFDNVKHREEHSCPGFENTGNSLICHRHQPPLVMKHQSELEKHLKTHLEGEVIIIPRLSCPVCHKKFLMRKNLNGHMRRFHEEKDTAEFKCKYCTKAFLFKSNCEEHENTHTGQAQFKCHCGKNYCSNKALLQHQKHVHDNKESYQCKICDKILSNQYKLRYHMGVHSDRRNFVCNFCDAKFKSKPNFAKHMSKHHRNESSTTNKPNSF